MAPQNIQTELNFCLETLSPIQPMLGFEAMVLKASNVTNSEAINKLDSSDLLPCDRNQINTGANKNLVPECTAPLSPTGKTIHQ